MNKMKIVFTGGGTGGHVYPNIAVYQTIKEKYPDSTFKYIGTKKGAENKIVREISQPIDFVSVLSRAMPYNIKSPRTLISLFFIFLGTMKSLFVLRKFKPDIIFGSGGYVAAPVILAAALLRLKVFIHEQNVVPGRLNRFVARFSEKIAISFSSSAEFFPKNKVVFTGYPIRQSIDYSHEENIKEKYKINEKNKVLFIFGGSRGAKTLNNAITNIMPLLLKKDDLTVILATGRGYSREYKAFDETLRKLKNMGIHSEIEGKLIIREYFDNIEQIYSISDLVVSRAGAGTIKEITRLGIPAILIPKINLPGDHQILNAVEMQKIGGARIVFEDVREKDGKRTIYVPEDKLLRSIEDIIFEETNLQNMKNSLNRIEKVDSNAIILTNIEQLIEGKESTEEKKIKIFYLQSTDSEKSFEIIFDSTTFGNTILADVFLEDLEGNVLFEIKNLNKDKELVLKRLKGKILINGEKVERLKEIKEDDKLEIGNKVYLLKSYQETVKEIHFEKPTSTKIWGSSFGIMVSRLGGFFREIVTAAVFGAGRTMDIFAVGLTVSNFMRRMVAENALENAFLPIFSRIFYRTSRKKTWEAASSIINFTLILSLVFTILGILFAPIIIKTLFPGFIEKGMLNETVNMIRLMFPYLFLVSIAAILATYLKAFNRFGIAESSAIFFSVGMISGIFLFYSIAGIYSLAYGVLLGGLFHILFLIPFLSKVFKNKALQFSYKPLINFTSMTNKKYYYQLGPISIDIFLSNTSEVIHQFLASSLTTGSISYLYYARRIFTLPFAVIAMSINMVILKEFSDKVALFNKEKAKKLFLDGIKSNLFLLAPISILMIILAEPVVSLLLERFNFSSAHVANTSFALKFYSLGLIGWGIHSLTARIFAARIDIKTSMVLNLFILITNIVLCFYLVNTSLEFAGLALATSISFLLFSAIRIIVLKAKMKKEKIIIKFKEISESFLKTLVASFLMIIVLVESRNIFKKIYFSSQDLRNIILLISLSFIGISIYLLSSLLLKNTEILIFKKKLTKKPIKLPVSLLSPFKFLAEVNNNPEKFKDDYIYKTNIYTSSRNWEIRNIGIKLIGLFKDENKTDYLINILKSGKENGFIRRNALIALKQMNIWRPDIKELLIGLLKDSYYEVRVAAINYLAQNISADDYQYFKEIIDRMLKKSTQEEKIACLRLIAKIGDQKELIHLKYFYLTGNSILREELIELIYSFFQRNIISGEKAKELLNKILITSNNLKPEFKLKSRLRKIYEEIDKI